MRTGLALLPILLLGGILRAADAPATASSPALYTFKGTFKLQGDICLLKFAILKTQGDLKTEIAARPSIQMKDGQSVELLMSDGQAPAAHLGEAATQAAFSGYKLTAIKPTSSNQVTYLFTVVENDRVTFVTTGTLAPETPAAAPTK